MVAPYPFHSGAKQEAIARLANELYKMEQDKETKNKQEIEKLAIIRK